MYFSKQPRFSQFWLTVLALALMPLRAAGDSVPDALSSETARSADSFVDSIGVNVKLSYLDTPYGDFDKLEAVLKRSGIRHIRDGLTAKPEIQQRLLKLHADGIGATLIVDGDALIPGFGPQNEFLKRMAVLAPAVEMFEGTNEADAGCAFDGKQFPSSLDELQHILYRTVKNGPYAAIPVIAPSMGYPPNSTKIPNEPGDFGNIHSYHGARNPGTTENRLDLPKFYLGNSAIVSPGKPVICTETGNPTAAYPDPGLWMPRISEWAQGKYSLRTYLEYFNSGIVRTFIHELIDEHPNPYLDEQNFGLLRNDWSPKPAFTGITNTIAILSDPAPKAFTPSALSYQLTGEMSNVHHTLLQKRDGTFYLVLWQEAPSYDPNRFQDIGVPDAAVQLQVRPTEFDAVYTYQPMAWSTPCALDLVAADGTVKLNVADQPLIVQLLPAGADLVVSSAGVVGDGAESGRPVKFKAVVTNQGTAPTPAGVIVSVTFFDETAGAHQMLTYSAKTQDAIGPGQSISVESDHDWTPGHSGKYVLGALVDDLKRVPETERANDHLTLTIEVK